MFHFIFTRAKSVPLEPIQPYSDKACNKGIRVLAEKGNLGSGPLELEIKMKQTAEKAYVSHRYSANIKHPASIF